MWTLLRLRISFLCKKAFASITIACRLLEWNMNIYVWNIWQSRQATTKKIINDYTIKTIVIKTLIVFYFKHYFISTICMFVLYVQGDSSVLDSVDDGADYKTVRNALKVCDFTSEEQVVRSHAPVETSLLFSPHFTLFIFFIEMSKYVFVKVDGHFFVGIIFNNRQCSALG